MTFQKYLMRSIVFGLAFTIISFFSGYAQLEGAALPSIWLELLVFFVIGTFAFFCVSVIIDGLLARLLKRRK